MVRSSRSGLTFGIVCLLLGGAYWLATGRAEPPAAAKPQPKKQSGARKDKEKEPALAKFMRAKLEASAQILEGLCTEDYAIIEKGAETLKSMSREERWRVSNDVMYRQHSAEYRDSVENILKAAKEKKNLDTAALAWTKTTLNCIECHRWVRNILLAKAPELESLK